MPFFEPHRSLKENLLTSLTGKLPNESIAQPQLPARAGGKDRT
jgi:hypothetical protein